MLNVSFMCFLAICVTLGLGTPFSQAALPLGNHCICEAHPWLRMNLRGWE